MQKAALASHPNSSSCPLFASATSTWICPGAAVQLGCLSKVTCHSTCQILSSILRHVSQMPQQKSQWEAGSASGFHLPSLPVLAGPCYGWLPPAAACPGVQRAWESAVAKLQDVEVDCLSFLLMLCASVLTVNLHLKQPSATELSAWCISATQTL